LGIWVKAILPQPSGCFTKGVTECLYGLASHLAIVVIVVGQACQRGFYAALECPDIKDEGVHQRHLVVATQVFHLVHHGRDLPQCTATRVLGNAFFALDCSAHN
jgi:hypothetical protein